MTSRHALHCGSIAIPRSTVADAWATRPRTSILRDINRRDVFQTMELPPSCERVIKAALDRYGVSMWVTTGRSDEESYETSLLVYRNVAEHDDAWQPVRSPDDQRHRLVESGFLHVFISGRGILTVGNKSIPFKRGDVVLHNPNVPHSVQATSRYCASVCATVPLKHAWDKVKSYRASHGQ